MSAAGTSRSGRVVGVILQELEESNSVQVLLQQRKLEQGVASEMSARNPYTSGQPFSSACRATCSVRAHVG